MKPGGNRAQLLRKLFQLTLISTYLQFGEPIPICVLFDVKLRRSHRDTVGSVGVIPKRLPFTTFNTHVKHFRQALALDEHRVRFKPNFFNRPTPEEVALGLKWGQGQISVARGLIRISEPGRHSMPVKDFIQPMLRRSGSPDVIVVSCF